jgi:hypothetical protein
MGVVHGHKIKRQIRGHGVKIDGGGHAKLVGGKIHKGKDQWLWLERTVDAARGVYMRTSRKTMNGIDEGRGERDREDGDRQW